MEQSSAEIQANNQVRTLVMTKHADKKSGFIYRVLDIEGNTIAIRHSSRNYIACYIVPNKEPGVGSKVMPYYICNCFSRKDLIGKADSRKIIPYAIAYLQEPDNFF